MTSISLPARLFLLALSSLSSLFFLHKSRRLRVSSLPPPTRTGKLFFASQTRTSETLARRLLARLTSHDLPFDLVDPRHYEPEDLQKESLVLIVASTWVDGKPPPNAGFLARWLEESAEDFRVGAGALGGCRFAVFGVGSSAYGEERFNAAAKGFAVCMRKMGAVEMVGVGDGDVDGGDVDEVFDVWSEKVVGVIKGGVRDKVGMMEAINEEESYFEEGDEDEEEEAEMEENVVDLEDIAGKAPTRKSPVAKVNGEANGLKEMVTPVIRTSLEKQVSD